MTNRYELVQKIDKETKNMKIASAIKIACIFKIAKLNKLKSVYFCSTEYDYDVLLLGQWHKNKFLRLIKELRGVFVTGAHSLVVTV